MVKKIYLIRHGQTDFNLKRIVQGSGVDSDLNEHGQWQAAQFFAHYRDVPFEKILISSLKRTYQTVLPFIQQSIPYERRSELNEISWGVLEGNPITTEEDQYYFRMLRAWRNGDVTLSLNGGESPMDVAKRQKPVLDFIVNESFHHLLICMHGRAMRILLCQLMRVELRRMDEFPHTNGGLYILEGEKDFTITKQNDVAHLL